MISTVTLNPALDVILEVDDLHLNQYNHVNNAKIQPGGKGINVSKAVRACGRETIAIGFLGGGRGRIIEEDLRKFGITTNFWHIENKTRSNTIIYDKKHNHHTLLSETGPKITEYDVEMILSIFYRIMSQSEMVALSGSIPPGVPEDIYATMIEIAKDRGVRSILDASGVEFAKGLEKQPFFAKPDLRKSNEVFGIKINSKENAIKAAKEIVARGAEVSVVSFELEKDVFATKDNLWFSESSHQQIVNLIGAADALVAGLAVALTEGDKTLEEAIKFSMSCALASALSEEEEFDSREQVDKCRNCIKIAKL